MKCRISHPARLTLVMLVLLRVVPAEAQQIGHRILGTLGLLAGSQPDSGLYVIDLFVSYRANEFFDSEGHRIPGALDLDGRANLIGTQLTFKLPWPSMYMNVALAAPIARVRLQSDQPFASIDLFGFGDAYIQPVRIGRKTPRTDMVAGYALYIPTGLSVPTASGKVGLGQVTNEFSLGGTLYFDRAKTWNISALASYDLYLRKQGADITRGDTTQVQGGAGKTLLRPGKSVPRVDLGLTGYGLWQVRDDRGSDLPAVLRDARDLDLGMGAEIGVTIAPIRSRITVRYSHDVVVRARPLGQILVVGLTIVARR